MPPRGENLAENLSGALVFVTASRALDRPVQPAPVLQNLGGTIASKAVLMVQERNEVFNRRPKLRNRRPKLRLSKGDYK